MSEDSAGAAAPQVQESDSTRTPREGEAAAPTSLLKVLQDMCKEGSIVPSRQFMRMVREETQVLRWRNASEDLFDKGDSNHDGVVGRGELDRALVMGVARSPLLTPLVEQILEFCKIKLLDKELAQREVTGACELPDAAEEREERLAKLLRGFTETYGQLLLAYSDAKPAMSARQRKPASASMSHQASARSLDSDATWRSQRRMKQPFSARSSHQTSSRSLASPRALFASEASGADDSADRLATASRSPSRSSTLHHPTPFYESVYALVARAVQQGMRAAAEGSRIAQEKGGLSQLAVLVEMELGRLFRSHEFGRTSGRGLRKGGAKVDAGGGSEGVESAQLAARAEAELGKLIKSASQLTTRLHSDFFQLELRLQRNNQEVAKQPFDQADKAPVGGADSKEVVADHGISHGSVDALIAGYWARAGPKKNRTDHKLMLQHVITTRSPMITSLLPSAHVQSMEVKQAVRRRQINTARVTSQRAQLNGGHIVSSGNAKLGSTLSPEVLADAVSPPAFKNSWALSQDRVMHNAIKLQPPPSVLWFATSKEAVAA